MTSYWNTCGADSSCLITSPTNTSGRAYPDVAMAGYAYDFVSGGTTHTYSGTAASVVTVAGMVSLVNAERAAQSQPPVGWINQALYSTNVTFTNDITSGSSQCLSVHNRGHTVVCCESGYNATVGWDPVTGLGSVDYAKFKTIFPPVLPSRRSLRAGAALTWESFATMAANSVHWIAKQFTW